MDPAELGRKGYIIGLEGGGTRTRCLVASPDGTVRGEGKGGPSNILAVGREKTRESIEDAVNEAMGSHRKDEMALLLCMGAAGCGYSKGRDLMTALLEELRLSPRNMAVSDGIISLLGATAGRPGVVAIAGTGSVCYGMNSEGKFQRASGWGYVLGDEGSGYDIARRAMTLALRSYDGRGEPTMLVDKFVTHLKLSCIEDLIGKVYAEGMEPRQISALAPLVLEAAREGDKVAIELLSSAGRELGIGVVAVARQLGMLNQEFEVVAVGGVLENFGAFVLEPFRTVVIQHAPKAVFGRARFNPVAGAVILAARELGLTVDDRFLKNLERSRHDVES